MRIPRAFFIIVISVSASLYSSAQPSDYFLSVHHQEATEETSLEIRVDLIRAGGIQEIFFNVPAIRFIRVYPD